MPLVSILTPVYNGAAHLHSCIDSILAQTWTDWEYIIVNNCSQDGTLSIAEDYAYRDKRIRIVNNKNFVDVNENHNIAFSQINPDSDYCKVVHADDLIYHRCLEKFVKICEENPTITLASAYRLDNDRIGLKGLPPSQSVFSGRAIARSYLLDNAPRYFGSPTTFFLRAGPVRARQPFFNTFHRYADHEACIQVLREGDFGFIHEVLTFTRREPDRESNITDYQRGNLPAFLCILRNHGPAFLSKEEYARRVRLHLRFYYLTLARDALNFRRPREYWRYHFNSLRELGYPFNPINFIEILPLLVIEKWRHLKERRRMDRLRRE